MKPEITVIVPVYNVERYLDQCLDSLQCQTYPNLQVLIVNDGSTDRSPQIAWQRVQQRPDRFCLLQKPNGGLSDARNFAIPYATGEWIGFLDSDDYADPDYYEKMAEQMAKGMDVVVSDIEYFYEDGRQPWRMQGLNPHAFSSVQRQAFLSPMFAWNKLYRASLFTEQGFRYPTGTWYEDIPVTMPIFALSSHIGYQKEALIHYRQRPGSIMSETASQRLKEIFPVMQQVRDQFHQMGIEQKYAQELEYLHIEHLRLYGMFRFLRSPLSRELYAMSQQVMREHYPHWHRNPYLRQRSWKNRVFLRTLNAATLPLYRRLIR